MTKTTINQAKDGTITFELTLTAATIAAEYQKVLQEVAKTAQIKGFRPGKAPLAMVEAQADTSKLYSHVLDHLLSPAYSAVIHEHKLVPLIEPRVTPKSMPQGKDWVMAVELATIPEVDLGDYQKLLKSALAKHAKTHQPDPKEDENKAKDHKLNVIFDALLDGIKFSVAPLLVEEETKSALSRLINQLSSLKLSVADYAKSIKKTSEELINEYKKSAEANLKLEFILQAITKDQKFKAEEKDLSKKYHAERQLTLDFLSRL